MTKSTKRGCGSWSERKYQRTLSLQAWSTRTEREYCKADGKGQHYSVDKAGIWVDCVHSREPVIHNDYANLANKNGLPAGHAVLPHLRQLHADVPVIIATGRPDQATMELAQSYARVSLLPKPFTLEEFRVHLEQVTAASH